MTRSAAILCALVTALVVHLAIADLARAAETTKPGGTATASVKMVKVTRDAPCQEFGPGASEDPWDVTKGSFVELLSVDGNVSIVETAPGMPPCRIASDALGPT